MCLPDQVSVLASPEYLIPRRRLIRVQVHAKFMVAEKPYMRDKASSAFVSTITQDAPPADTTSRSRVHCSCCVQVAGFFQILRVLTNEIRVVVFRFSIFNKWCTLQINEAQSALSEIHRAKITKVKKK